MDRAQVRSLLAFLAILLILAVALVAPPVIVIGKIMRDPKINHVFWTGGYDSTFRVLQLIAARQYVQPIYIISPNTDAAGIFAGRRNKWRELAAMRKIRQMARKKWPWAAEHLLPTVFVIRTKYDGEIKRAMANLMAAGHLSRRVGQYGAMASFARYYRLVVDECAEKGPHTILGKIVRPYLKNGRLSAPFPADLAIFRQFNFPIIDWTKEDMLEWARANNCANILAATISCWYPSISGRPCGKCHMCRERIIN